MLQCIHLMETATILVLTQPPFSMVHASLSLDEIVYLSSQKLIIKEACGKFSCFSLFYSIFPHVSTRYRYIFSSSVFHWQVSLQSTPQLKRSDLATIIQCHSRICCDS